MRFLADYLIPLLVIAFAYVGLQKLVTRSSWPFFFKAAFHLVGAVLILVMIMYEYFAGRSIMDMVREGTGNTFCRIYMVDSCPASIKYEVTREEVDRRTAAAKRLVEQQKAQQAVEERAKAEEAARRASELQRIVQEKQKLAEVAAALKAAARPGNGLILRRSAIVGDCALQSWVDEPAGGEAILKFDRSKGRWIVLEWGGGAWTVELLDQSVYVWRCAYSALQLGHLRAWMPFPAT